MGDSNRWKQRQANDPYVKQAKKDGYRARSSYKLLEIQQKYRIFKPGDRVFDAGAAPGGWSQVARQAIGSHGQVIACDILSIDPLPGVQFIQGDLTHAETQQKVVSTSTRSFDVALCDVSPNLTGDRWVDQYRFFETISPIIALCLQLLKPNGHLLFKIFEGPELDSFMKIQKKNFLSVKWIKPQASRDRSAEKYVLAVKS